MTDNEQAELEDILDTLAEKSADSDSRLGYVDAYEFAQEAKQAILNMSVPHNPPSNTTRTNLYRKGYNDSLDQFEQNLLKALEEK